MNRLNIDCKLQLKCIHIMYAFIYISQWPQFKIILSKHTVCIAKSIAKSRAKSDSTDHGSKKLVWYQNKTKKMRSIIWLWRAGANRARASNTVGSEFAINFAIDIAIQTVWKQCKLFNNGTLFESAQERQVRLFS